MPAEFNYPSDSINKSNYVLASQSGEQVIQVPSPNRSYDYFHWIEPNPETPLSELDEENEETITYSKLAMRWEAVTFIMSGGNILEINDNWFIRLPSGFDIGIAEQWMIGGSFSSGAETKDFKSFVPARAWHYAEEFEVLGSPSPVDDIDAGQVRADWRNTIRTLLIQKYGA